MAKDFVLQRYCNNYPVCHAYMTSFKINIYQICMKMQPAWRSTGEVDQFYQRFQFKLIVLNLGKRALQK